MNVCTSCKVEEIKFSSSVMEQYPCPPALKIMSSFGIYYPNGAQSHDPMEWKEWNIGANGSNH